MAAQGWTSRWGNAASEMRPASFCQDVPGVLDEFNTLQLATGEFFGEVSALSRNPRSATVFAEVKTRVLEIRWARSS